MRVQLTKLSDTKFKLQITAEQSFINSAKRHVLGHLSSQTKIQGFRPGKAPLEIIEKQVDPTVLQREFLDEAVNSLYVQAIKAENLKPVSQPKIEIKKFVPFTELVFEAEVEAVGEIKLGNYKNIKLTKPKISITAKDVSDVLASLQTRLAERKPAGRPIKRGDELIIDFIGTDLKGNKINGADGKDMPLIVGSNTFIPGFEDNLIGQKVGQEKEFVLTFPKDYGVNALRAKKVKFNVTVKTVSELELPALDDNFAAKAGPFKTLKDLKEDIKKQLTAERQSKAERDYENQLVAEISNKSQVKVPESLIDEQVLRAEEQERQNLAYRGQTWQEHLKEEGVTEQEHRARNRSDAETNVKAGLVLAEIAEREKLVVTPEELEIRIQILKSQYTDERMRVELDKPENRRDVESRLLTEKTLVKLKNYIE